MWGEELCLLLGLQGMLLVTLCCPTSLHPCSWEQGHPPSSWEQGWLAGKLLGAGKSHPW